MGLDKFQCRAVLLIWIIERAGATGLAVGVGGEFLACRSNVQGELLHYPWCKCWQGHQG